MFEENWDEPNTERVDLQNNCRENVQNDKFVSPEKKFNSRSHFPNRTMRKPSSRSHNDYRSKGLTIKIKAIIR